MQYAVHAMVVLVIQKAGFLSGDLTCMIWWMEWLYLETSLCQSLERGETKQEHGRFASWLQFLQC